MKEIAGGVTAPQGFMAASCAAKIKYQNRTDMAMIYTKKPAVSAGVYTSSVVKAAPVLWDRAITRDNHPIHAIVANSGIANACTGEEGFGYCSSAAEEASKLLGIKQEEVLIASTGVIGMPMPMDRVKAGIKMLVPALHEGPEAGEDAAKAIMTTDTKEKIVAVEFEISGTKVRMGGICKGSGMIHPNMCTMLAFVTTDAVISKELLQKALSVNVQETFNMISVDGDMSTNDTVLLVANGAAGNVEINEEDGSFDAFLKALNYINRALAIKIAGDGEGATALFTVEVTGADTHENAKKLARGVVCSNLVKTAIAGHDANWGRVFGALGNAGAPFDPGKVDLTFSSAAGSVAVAKNGMAAEYSEELATKVLSEPEVTAEIELHGGTESATAWGCDLTHGYISINADYRS